MKTTRMPAWAGMIVVPFLAYFLNNFILVSLPYLETLPELGVMPYFTTMAGILGIWFVLVEEDDNAITCEELCVLCGLAGTMLGLTQYLDVSKENMADIFGIRYVFLTGYHGIVMAAQIKFLLLLKKERP